MAEESVGQRFSQLIQQLGMSKNAFAMSLDKTATVIQHLVDERNKPGFDLMCKVFEVYPNVSKDWLLLGKGPMLLSDASVPVAPSVAADLALAPAAPAAVARSLAAPAATTTATTPTPTPHFPEPLFTVSAARPALPEIPTVPTVPAAAPAPEPVPAPTPAVAAATSPQLVAAPALGAALPEVPPVASSPVPSLAPSVPAAPVASPDAAALTAALHAQYLQHQLALAEQRNQHLLEQQQLMQQMLELMRQNR